MVPQIDEWTIVLLGAWNPRIFSPPWIGENLLGEKKKLEIEFGVAPGAHQIRYRTDNMLLIPRDDRLIIGATNTGDETLGLMEQVACKTLALLPHTPIVAVGVNFGYFESFPEAGVLKLFDTADLSPLAEFGCQVSATELRRQITTDLGVVNLKHIFHEGKVKIHLNFHSQTQSTDEAREHLAGKVIAERQFAQRFLEKVYGLTVEQEEEYSHDVGE